MLYSKPLEKLINALNKLPGIGPKTAQRLAFYILRSSPEEARDLSASIINAKENLRYCSVCGSITEKDPCAFCTSAERDPGTICIIEQPQDIFVIEKTRGYKGTYHVLMGALSPLDGVGPDDLRINGLIERLKKGGVKEVILATNPNVEGEATALYLAKALKPFQLKLTRLAHGIPMGGDIEYADEMTLAMALEGRTRVTDDKE